MPATSPEQRTAMAIAEHEPDKLYERNKSMLKMKKSQLHDFASTKGLGAPKGSKPPRQLSRPGNSKASSGLLSSNRKIQGIPKG